MARLSDDQVTKKVLKGEIVRGRKRGRSRKRWIDTVRRAQHKQKWRHITNHIIFLTRNQTDQVNIFINIEFINAKLSSGYSLLALKKFYFKQHGTFTTILLLISVTSV